MHCAPPQAVLGACLDSPHPRFEFGDLTDAYAIPQLIIANFSIADSLEQPHGPGLVLSTNGTASFDASCWAAYLWVRAHLDAIWARLGCRPADLAALRRPGGRLPVVHVSCLPAMAKTDSSLGVAFAITLVSLLTRRPVRRDVGVTGEMDMRGWLLGVGGVRIKAQGLAGLGVQTMLMPEDCDYDDLRRTGIDTRVECEAIWDMLERALSHSTHHNAHYFPPASAAGTYVPRLCVPAEHQ